MLCAFFVLMGGSLHFGEAAAVQPTDGPTRPPSMSAEDEGADVPAVSEEPDASPSPAAEPEVFNLSFIGDITPDAVPERGRPYRSYEDGDPRRGSTSGRPSSK